MSSGVVTKEQDVSKQRRGVCGLINTLENNPNKGEWVESRGSFSNVSILVWIVLAKL